MAKLDMGILGPFRGKVGTVVGYVWRGRAVMRGYRRHINYPDTAIQQAERQWFVGMVRFAAAARQALLLGLGERAAEWQMTEGNAFVKMNKTAFHRPPYGCEGATETVDYEHLVLSCGAAAPVRVTAAQVDADGVLCVDYEKHGSQARGSDSVHLYLYNTDTREGLLAQPAERRAGRIALRLPDGWDAANVQAWAFAVDRSGRASATSYAPFGANEPSDLQLPETQTHPPTPSPLANDAGALSPSAPPSKEPSLPPPIPE